MTTSVRALWKEAIPCNSTWQLDAVNVLVTHDTSRLLGRQPTHLTSDWNMIKGEQPVEKTSDERGLHRWQVLALLLVSHVWRVLPSSWFRNWKTKAAPDTGDEELSVRMLQTWQQQLTSLHDLLCLCLSPTAAKLIRRLRYLLFTSDTVKYASSSQKRWLDGRQ